MKHAFCLIAGILCVMLGCATGARAQSPYVGASIGADVARFASDDRLRADGSGEVLSWALRVGTPVGERWGVELEFVRPQEIEGELSPYYPLITSTPTFENFPADLIAQLPTAFPLRYTIETRRRNTTITAAAWVRQEITPRFSLQYLGGIGFSRMTLDSNYAFAPLLANVTLPSLISPYASESVRYGVGPMVGLDARVGLTDHVQVVPGVRMYGVDGGWLLRPMVGIAWAF